jgi:hypothetical protein
MLFSSKNSFTETYRIMFDHISELCGPTKMSHKINHNSNNKSEAAFGKGVTFSFCLVWTIGF